MSNFRKILPEELSLKFKSKQDLYRLLSLDRMTFEYK